ncbi:MAG: hypothetical protein OSA85_00385 [Psychrobacter pacificensis]|uniref:hypothetical protein n=1 Tax=Psychrobacter pacificensis TaxID=112002 RepID=UPI002384E622|nr:hypothetical protein [Psychrobacter pacificensis]MDE0842511.1 hypothetical protein [Psychrobacter pacificensis]
MSQKVLYLNTRFYKSSLASLLLMAAVSVQAAPTAPNAEAANPTVAPINQPAVGDAATSSALDINDTLAAQLQPSTKALSEANQELLSRNAQLQRQVNDLQTQANVLVYESKGQLFLYGAFTVLISLLVGIFISWLVFVRRDRW